MADYTDDENRNHMDTAKIERENDQGVALRSWGSLAHLGYGLILRQSAVVHERLRNDTVSLTLV